MAPFGLRDGWDHEAHHVMLLPRFRLSERWRQCFTARRRFAGQSCARLIGSWRSSPKPSSCRALPRSVHWRLLPVETRSGRRFVASSRGQRSSRQRSRFPTSPIQRLSSCHSRQSQFIPSPRLSLEQAISSTIQLQACRRRGLDPVRVTTSKPHCEQLHRYLWNTAAEYGALSSALPQHRVQNMIPLSKLFWRECRLAGKSGSKATGQRLSRQ